MRMMAETIMSGGADQRQARPSDTATRTTPGPKSSKTRTQASERKKRESSPRPAMESRKKPARARALPETSSDDEEPRYGDTQEKKRSPEREKRAKFDALWEAAFAGANTSSMETIPMAELEESDDRYGDDGHHQHPPQNLTPAPSAAPKDGELEGDVRPTAPAVDEPSREAETAARDSPERTRGVTIGETTELLRQMREITESLDRESCPRKNGVDAERENGTRADGPSASECETN